MRINQATIDLIKNFEGWRSVAYRDAVGVLTIGYGHTSAAGKPEVKTGLNISKEQGEEILRTDVRKFAKGVEALVKIELTGNQFGALVSFAYNVGLGNFKKSSVLRVVNAGQLSRVPDRLALWNKAGGRVLKGLVRRRGKEGELFSQEDDEAATNASGFDNYDEQPDFPTDALRLGANGEQVKTLQRQLNGLGYFSGNVDGKFGKRTRAAVLAFQADNNLTTDGLIGEATTEALSDATPRQISLKRDAASIASLATDGSRIADASMKSLATGTAVSVSGIVSFLPFFSDTFKSLKIQLAPVLEPFGGMSEAITYGLLIAVAYLTWQAWRSGSARVEDHKSGKTA